MSMVCNGNVCMIIPSSPEENQPDLHKRPHSHNVNTQDPPHQVQKLGPLPSLDDILHKIFSLLLDTEVPILLSVCQTFWRLLYPRWRLIFEKSPSLQNQRRLYYHRRSNNLSIVYSSIEKAYAKKFVGFNSKLGVSAYSYISSGINIFARVRPAAIGHEVGAIYTFTRWQQRETAQGWWVENTPQGEEIWRINISYDERKCEEIWFSVYVRDSTGTESWDSNDGWNYAVNVLSMPSKTYDLIHPAVHQHEKNLSQKASPVYPEEEEDFVEEVWLNVNHVMCG